MESKRPAPAARSEPGRRAIASGPAPAPALRADGPVLNRRGPVDRRLIRIIQRTAGNLAAGSLVVEREPAPTFEQGRARATGPITFEWGGGRGSQAPAIPTAPSDPAGRTAPELTPGGYKAAAALALADGVRKHLDRVALEAERSAALSALLAKEPAIYDTLHTSPGKGLIVNLNFKSTDPETLKGRPPDLKVPLQLKFVGVSVSAPFELPEPSTGPAIGPGASGPGFVGYGWKGRTLTVTVQPVRPDPGKDRRRPRSSNRQKP